MSMERKEKIVCPNCGQKQDFTIWQSLNGDIDPEAKQQLLDGTLFRFKCRNCGNISFVNYSMLYHDMTNRAMVYLVDAKSVAKTLKTIENTEKQTGITMPGYRKRIVTDLNVLREKAIIFNSNLDDRIIEIIKLIYYFNACKQVPDAKINAVYFSIANGKYVLDFMGDKPLNTEVPASMYEDIKRDFSERLKAVGDNEAMIDSNWASAFLQG